MSRNAATLMRRQYAAILEDVEAGERLILLSALPAERWMPRPRGKPLHKSVPFRWKDRAENPLEVLKTPAGWATTAPAARRFFAALSGPAAPPPVATRTPARRQRDLARAEARLNAAGI